MTVSRRTIPRDVKTAGGAGWLACTVATLPRRLAAVAAVLLSAGLAGCHHRARVSQTAPPPTRGNATAARRAPVEVVPQGPVDDNAVSPGRLHSSEIGFASWYGPPYNRRAGANGEIFDQNALTAAHRTLPMGTVLLVTNLLTNQTVTVRVTDRGPFIHGRVLDLSLGAAKEAGIYRAGVAQVQMDVVEQGPHAAVPGKWAVQVGAFLDRENAYHLQVDLQRRYTAAAKVIAFQGPTGWWVRVTPPGADRARASQMARVIHTAEPDALPYLVRLD